MLLRNQLSLAVVLALAVVFGVAPTVQARVSVFVTLLPQKYVVERVAGDLAEVNVLVLPGASPHTYEPTPRQMTALSGADAYFAVGVNLEEVWLPRVRSANPSIRVFGVQRGVKKIPMAAHGHQGEDRHAAEAGHEEHDHAAEAEHDEHEGHHHGTLDPHIWLDPARFAQMARNTCRGLVKIDPANASIYQANLTTLLTDIETVDADISAMLAPIPEDRRTFLVFHPAWGYFADRYHLTQVAIEAEGKEPGPKEMAAVLDLCRERHIRVIFVQPQLSARSAETIASELDAQVAPLDPLAEDWKGNLMKAAEAFKKSLE